MTVIALTKAQRSTTQHIMARGDVNVKQVLAYIVSDSADNASALFGVT